MKKFKPVPFETRCKAYILLCKIGKLESYSPKEVAVKLEISEHLAWRRVTQLRNAKFVSINSMDEKSVQAFEKNLKIANPKKELIEVAREILVRYSLLKSKQGKLILAALGTESLRVVEIQERTGLLQPNIAAFLAKAVKVGLVISFKPNTHTLYTKITTNVVNQN